MEVACLKVEYTQDEGSYQKQDNWRKSSNWHSHASQPATTRTPIVNRGKTNFCGSKFRQNTHNMVSKNLDIYSRDSSQNSRGRGIGARDCLYGPFISSNTALESILSSS